MLYQPFCPAIRDLNNTSFISPPWPILGPWWTLLARSAVILSVKTQKAHRNSGLQGPMTLRLDHAAVTHPCGWRGWDSPRARYTMSERRFPSVNNLSFIDLGSSVPDLWLCHATVYDANTGLKEKKCHSFQVSITPNTPPPPFFQDHGGIEPPTKIRRYQSKPEKGPVSITAVLSAKRARLSNRLIV